MTYSPTIINHVLIDGRYRSDVRVESVSNPLGLTTPGTAVIAAPLDKFLKEPYKKGQTIIIRLDRASTSKIHFAGVIVRRIADRGAEYSFVRYECEDLRYLLNAAVVDRDFNFNRDRYGENEHLAFSAICRKIVEQFNSDYSVNFKVRTGGLDTVESPEQLVKGSSVAAALENIAAQGGAQQRARWFVEYLSATQLRLSVTHRRVAMRRRINFATDKDAKYNAQPHGWPVPSRILESKDASGFINRVIAKGDRRKVQVTLTLTQGWSSSLTATQVSNILQGPRDLYTTGLLPDGTANSEYIAGADRVGTHYRIPTVSLTGNNGSAVSLRPNIQPSLVQDDFITANQPIPGGAFLVYNYEGEGLAVRTDGFSIDNGLHVILNEPLFTVRAVSGSVRYVVPDTVFLVCAIKDTVHLEHDTGKVGSEPWTVARRIARPEFKWTRYSNTYYLDSNGDLQYSSGTTDIRKDDTELQAAADAFIKNSQGAVQAYELENETFISTWNPGDLVRSHYRPVDGLNIAGITYTMDTENTRVARTTFQLMGANADA